MAFCLFKSLREKQTPGYKTLFFAFAAVLMAGLSLWWPHMRALYVPLAVGTTVFFGPEVFLPVWGAAVFSEAASIIHPKPEVVFLLLAACSSGAICHFALRRHRKKGLELRQKLHLLTENTPGLATGALNTREAADRELAHVLGLAKDTVNADAVSLFLAAPEGLALRLSTAGDVRAASEGLIFLCHRKKQPVVANNLKAHNPGYVRPVNILSLASSPVTDGNYAAGVLVADSPRAGAFAAQGPAPLERFASLIAGMLRRQRVYGELERTLRGFEILKEESSRLLNYLSIKDISAEALRCIKRITPLGGAIFLKTASGFELAGASGLASPRETAFKNLKGSLVEAALRGKEHIYISDLRNYSLAVLPFETGLPAAKAALIVPLVYEEETLGVLALVADRVGPLSVHQIELIRMFTNQLSVTFSRALLHDAMRLMATTDGLTGLYNHRHFQEMLAGEFKRLGRYPRPLSLLLIDIDHFKKVNDTHGHPAGDAVLKTMASVIKKIVRDTDIPARYGGEEFAAVLTDTDKAGAGQLAERLRASVLETPFVAEGKSLRITVSIGVASFPVDAPDKETMIELADKALYKAKNEGRNRVVLSGPSGTRLNGKSG